MLRLAAQPKFPWFCTLLGIAAFVALRCGPAVAQPAPGDIPAPTAPGATGRPEPGYLGIVGDDRQENGAGIRVIEIEAGGPAAAGGLKEDDLITAVGGKAVHSTADMGSILQPLPPGSKVSFEVERNGAKQTVTVTLGTRPAPDQRRYARFGRVPEEPLPDPNANPSAPGPAPGPGAFGNRHAQSGQSVGRESAAGTTGTCAPERNRPTSAAAVEPGHAAARGAPSHSFWASARSR